MSTNHKPAAAGQEAIWEYFQNEGSSWFEGAHSRLKFLASQLRPAQRVLNIGIGSGLLEAEAQRLGLEAWSLDPSERAVTKLRNELQIGERAQVGYSQNMPFPEAQFDAVVASEVLEHLDNETLRLTLPEIKRVLKSGGFFLGTVPAREQLAAQTIVCPCCEQRFHRWGHHQSFTIERMRGMLGELFQVESVYEKYFAPWNTLNWKGRVLCSLKSLLSQLGVHGSEENIVFRARKAD